MDFRKQEFLTQEKISDGSNQIKNAFVYKAGAFIYFFRTKKFKFSQVNVITKFFDLLTFKYFEFI